MPYKATHIPYGLTDSSKRMIRNPGIKDEVEFTQFGIETGGERFTTKVLVQGGGGVPIHAHASYGETFYPIEGDVGVVGENGTKTMILKKGETYTVKPGEWHRFFNPSETESLRFNADVVPAHQGFEILLYVFYGLVNDGFGTPEGFPSSMYYQLMLQDMGEVSYPGVMGTMMTWASKVVGLIATMTGEKERLIQKYYGRPITQEEKTKWKVS